MPETCPTTGSAVLRQADLFAEIALAKSERYPFDPSDGVESVRRYRQSQACYAAGNVADAAAQMQAEGDFMERRVNEDYAAHRLRLERALSHQRFEDALYETQAILAILRREYQSHVYIQWLTRTKRHLRAARGARARGGSSLVTIASRIGTRPLAARWSGTRGRGLAARVSLGVLAVSGGLAW